MSILRKSIEVQDVVFASHYAKGRASRSADFFSSLHKNQNNLLKAQRQKNHPFIKVDFLPFTSSILASLLHVVESKSKIILYSNTYEANNFDFRRKNISNAETILSTFNYHIPRWLFESQI